MNPLRDANPSKTTPFVNYMLILLNGAVFFFEPSPGKGFDAFIFDFGLIPSQFLVDLHSMNFGLVTFLPLFTSMFLHGGWFHFLGNMLYLYIFGDNVEDQFGHVRYLFFYLTAGIAAALTQVYINQYLEVPMVGASGAIAGVIGAYIFMFPTAKVATLISLIIFFYVV